MKTLDVVAIAIVCCTMASCAAKQTAMPPEDTSENRRLAAEEYLRTASLEGMMQDAASEVAKTVPEPARAAFLRAFFLNVDMERLSTAMTDSLVKNFTAAEIEAMAQFYGSAVGKAIMKKFGVYMAEVIPVVQAEVTKAATKAMEAAK